MSCSVPHADAYTLFCSLPVHVAFQYEFDLSDFDCRFISFDFIFFQYYHAHTSTSSTVFHLPSHRPPSSPSVFIIYLILFHYRLHYHSATPFIDVSTSPPFSIFHATIFRLPPCPACRYVCLLFEPTASIDFIQIEFHVALPPSSIVYRFAIRLPFDSSSIICHYLFITTMPHHTSSPTDESSPDALPDCPPPIHLLPDYNITPPATYYP